jgi:hypothetical protein
VIRPQILRASKICKKYRLSDQFAFFRIPKEAGVSHASLVLKDPIYATGASYGDEPLEKANPQFQDMIGGYSGHWMGSPERIVNPGE